MLSRPTQLELVDDYTNWTRPFHPETYDDVLDEDRRPIPGLKEEKVKAWQEKEVVK